MSFSNDLSSRYGKRNKKEGNLAGIETETNHRYRLHLTIFSFHGYKNRPFCRNAKIFKGKYYKNP